MGIDGNIIMGDGILINLYNLPNKEFNDINDLADKYENLFYYDKYKGIDRDNVVIIFDNPTILFNGLICGNRRPLILNNYNVQLPLLDNEYMNNNKLWKSSYENFTIQLKEYDNDYGEKLIDNIKNAEYTDYNDKVGKLNIIEYNILNNILLNKEHIFTGKYITYILD